MGVKFTDNSDEILDMFDEAVVKALTECGLVAVGYAKQLQHPNTGLLRNSITFALDGEPANISKYKATTPKPGRKNSGEYAGNAPEESVVRAVYIGTNVEYAPYVEYGTGKHVDGGRQDAWGYKGEDRKTHWTRGNPAKPFIKPAVADHAQQYRDIIKKELENA